MNRTLSLAAFFALTAAASADAQSAIDFADIPEKVLDAAIRTAPGVTFDRVSIEVENGVSIYEFEAKDHNGKHIEIDVTSSGEVEEIEMEISADDVPAAVTKTLENTAPGFRPSYIEMSVRNGGGLFVYEFEGEANGRPLDIEIAESGELLVYSDRLSS